MSHKRRRRWRQRCDPGEWTPAALRLTEAIAVDMVNEAAEWSALYAKGLRRRDAGTRS
jgi:hypothetical protein